MCLPFLKRNFHSSDVAYTIEVINVKLAGITTPFSEMGRSQRTSAKKSVFYKKKPEDLLPEVW